MGHGKSVLPSSEGNLKVKQHVNQIKVDHPDWFKDNGTLYVDQHGTIDGALVELTLHGSTDSEASGPKKPRTGGCE